MIFHPPTWLPKLSDEDIPTSLSVEEFIFSNEYRRHPVADTDEVFVCALSGRRVSTKALFTQIEVLTRFFSKSFSSWTSGESQWNRVVAIYSLNSIDTMAVAWAIHRAGGICQLIHVTSTEEELRNQLLKTKCLALFTCAPLIPLVQKVAPEAQLNLDKIFLLEIPGIPMQAPNFVSLSQILEQGSVLPAAEKRNTPFNAAQTVAYVCSSSGTSGSPKTVMVSHRNVIANILQIHALEQGDYGGRDPETTLCALPQSHGSIFLLLHAMLFRGDTTVVLPKFDMVQMLGMVQQYKVNRLICIPPIIAPIAMYPQMFAKFDLSSLNAITMGGVAPDPMVVAKMEMLYPGLKIYAAYGQTESVGCVSYTSTRYPANGSSGFLLPGCEATLISEDGTVIRDYSTPGELIVHSPSIVLGYLDDQEANRISFTDTHALRTGDLAEFRKDEDGTAHLYIIDRLKDVIKVNGVQVSPTELETALLAHPAVAEAAVIAAPDQISGEVPQAFIVLKPGLPSADHHSLADEIRTAFQVRVSAPHKSLKGGIHIIDEIPKGGNGKPLRRVLRTRCRQT